MHFNLSKKKSQVSRWKRLSLALIILIGAWLSLSALYLPTKAYVAQYLIADAWEKTLNEGGHNKPWSWADTHPIAKLGFPSLQETLYVLAGANGRNMAFGPAHTLSSGMPGQPLSTVISAHRDSHFAPLKHLRKGDVIDIQTTTGQFQYRITELQIRDSRTQRIPIQRKDQLILTTCYPFDALTSGGPMRYQVTAERIPSAPQLASAF
ncbi:class GN sortase [Marinicella sp. W31]|uniref:class GN sortase n=1 Tax=Marinicella sp. W31 TaxID=3023713 RepID=UPI003757738D